MARKIANIETLQKRIKSYFNSCDYANQRSEVNELGVIRKPYNLPSLIEHLGISKSTFIKYCEEEHPYSDTCLRAVQKIEAFLVEKMLIKDLDVNATMGLLKHKHDWKEESKKTLDVNVTYKDLTTKSSKEIEAMIVELKRNEEFFLKGDDEDERSSIENDN